MGSSHERTDENAGAPILARKDAAAPSVFSPGTVLREAQRQRHLTALRVPAHAAGRQVLCLAHVTNTMGSSLLEFEKGEGDGVTASLVLLAALVSHRLTQ